MNMENMRSQIGGGTVKYIKPQMEIVELSGENVIVTSCGGCGFADMQGNSIPICTSGDSGCSGLDIW